jgi:hypothetical protein
MGEKGLRMCSVFSGRTRRAWTWCTHGQTTEREGQATSFE